MFEKKQEACNTHSCRTGYGSRDPPPPADAISGCLSTMRASRGPCTRKAPARETRERQRERERRRERAREREKKRRTGEAGDEAYSRNIIDKTVHDRSV
jgi:hypothetical protein